MKSVVVTGANGFIGTALLKELTDYGVKVYAVLKDENENVESIKNYPNVEFVYCDMDNLTNLPTKIHDDLDVFYHLAWAGSTGDGRANHELQLKNVKWAVDAVIVAKELGCKRYLGAGTLAEYDVNAYSPVDGSTPNAVSNYGVAKITAHYMTKAECSKQGIEHLWAFLSNTYGIGNYTSNFVNFACKTMITGKDANFTSGEQPYDFVYVDDIAQGLFKIGETGKNNYSYYIGSTKQRKLKEFIKIMRDEIDPSIELHLGAVPFNGIPQPESTFDCTKLVEHTGYCPRISFEEGIKETVAWVRKQIDEGKL